MAVNIILDLDQTIISAEDNNDYDSKKHGKKALKFKYHELKEDGEIYYTIFERPGLQEFLTFIFANFNVSVWTAASKDYALFIIDKIIMANYPERKLDWIFFSYHCKVSNRIKNGTKDLSMLWDVYKLDGYTQNNTIIIDDYDEVHKTQPKNCVIAEAFEFFNKNSHKDKYLRRLKKRCLNLCASDNIAHKINKSMKTL